MKTKLLFGLSAIATTGIFWACGEGTPNPMEENDSTIEYLYVTSGEDATANLEAMRSEALKKCKADPECNATCSGDAECAVMMGAVPESSSGLAPIESSGSNPLVGSSSSSMVINIVSSSSTIPVVVNSSSSEEGQGGAAVTGLGSCAPVTTPVEKGKPAKFKFTPNAATSGYSAIDFAKAQFDWNYGVGGVGDGTASSVNSDNVVYAASGVANASVTVTMADRSTETIKCAPLQVNGDPITGCKCTTEAAGVDYLTTPDVVWTVTGCTSASDVNSYSWDGTEGTTSFTKTFTAATASYSPKLKVGNSDNTVIDVTCTPVKVTEGAEYTIADNQSKVNFDKAGTYNVVIGFACQNKTFYCNGSGAPVGGSVNGVAMASSWYTTASLTAADCTGSATVIVEVDGPASCGAQ